MSQASCLGCEATRRDQRAFCRHLVFDHGQDLPVGEARDLLDTLNLLEAKLKVLQAGAGSGGEMTWG